jgi:hypothetical protein
MNSNIRKNLLDFLLASLMFITLLNNLFFFVVKLKLGLGSWIAFNACSLAIITYLACFVFFRISKKEQFMAVSLLPLYYYGTMGLFLMPWNAANAFAQVTHIIITLSVFRVLYLFLKERNFDALGRGLLISILIFVPIFAYIQSFTQAHMNEFLEVLKKM